MISAVSASSETKRRLGRGLMNERAPLPVPDDILEVQDALLWTESIERGIVPLCEIKEIKNGISLWQGDITRLQTDGIVNAANKALLGCFLAGHHCIDNAIHSFAGMQVRRDCATIMAEQGGEEECGKAKITSAYNLPSKYILHTVGPMVGREVYPEERAALRSCYTSCLDLAEEAGLHSIAFCCISTGVFNYPQEEAAEIAIGTALDWKLRHPESEMKIVFNTFLPRDTQIYQNILK
ncbi:MAG: protein-ADP-ribose hydrolase [Clostridia bacterium]|nr:protein-ADP-ribose hydrolase [Clostridia bacterium]